MAKLHRLSRVKPDAGVIDSVKMRNSCLQGRNTTLLLMAQNAYMSMHRFRKERERNRRYTYGDQWGDIITVDGVRMTEGEYLRKQGCIPLKSNLIRRLMRNVIGVYRSQSNEPTCIARDREEQRVGETMSTVLQYNMQLNRMQEVYARSLEEFLISGMIVHKKTYGWRNDKLDCWTDYVQPNNFFIDANMRDFRGWDCKIVGELHDVSIGEVMQEFGHTPEQCRRIAEIYRSACTPAVFTRNWDDFGFPKDRNVDFLVPDNEGLCRVIEVWTLETKPRYRCHDYNNGDVFKVDIEDYEELVVKENERRLIQGEESGIPENEIPMIESEWFIDNYWYYTYLTPFGDVLQEGETPYEHKKHPYVFKCYPFIDSEIHSFVNDIIDQQRYTNRLISLYDWIMRASAKGVLMVPNDSLEGVSLEEFARTWSMPNGVIAYKPSKSGAMPQQLSANSSNIGIGELLNIQLKFFEDISGVNGALQGKPGYSGMSGTLYAQQTQNATTSLLDILDMFGDFVCEAARIDVKNMQQFYDQKRIFNIAGRGSVVEYDPQKIRDVEFDLSIVPSQATPAYRALANEFLIQIWQSGQISLQQLLQHGNFPFADELLQSLNSQQEQLANGEMPDGLSPELMQQVQQGVDMNAVGQAQQILRPQPIGE